MIGKRIGLFGLGLLSVTLTTLVFAQIEEVIVTAQKRAESIQDVPISMAALSGAEPVKGGGFAQPAPSAVDDPPAQVGGGEVPHEPPRLVDDHERAPPPVGAPLHLAQRLGHRRRA